jgi:ATP-binding cassette subfamily B protein
MNLEGLDRLPSRNLKSLREALRYLRPYWPAVGGATIALIVTAGVTLSIGQGLRILIDEGFAAGSNAILERSIGIFAILVVVLTAGTFARFYLVSWVGERVSADIRKEVFDHIVGLDPGFFDSNHASEIQTRVTTDTTLLQTVIGSSVSIALRNLLMLVGGVVLLVITNPKLSGIVVLFAPVVVAPIIIFGRRVRRLSRTSQDTIADVGTYVGEVLRNIKTVQSFNHERLDRVNLGDRVDRALRVAKQRIAQRAWLTALTMLLVLASIATMLWVGGQDVLTGRTTPGDLTAFIFYAFIVAGSVGALSEVIGELQRAAGAVERLLELRDAKSNVTRPARVRALATPVRGELVLEEVRFSYPSRRDVTVLRGVSMQVAAGETLAIVGPSGAGKSTLFDLILRFYDPDAGSIRLDGVDLRELDPTELRAHVGLVRQEPVLFTGTVLENIRYGRPEASSAEVRSAADAAHVTEFADALPLGFDTHLGEGGAQLSGGQRQRVALARAILKDPPLLLLDEATSSLDAASERAVQDAVSRLSEERTTLVVAHRLATVMNADRLVVLDAGEVIDVGTHAELLARNPLYARFAELQFNKHADESAPALKSVT